MHKTIVISDLHGKDIWKAILEKEKQWDTAVFMGDYFDSFDIPSQAQIDNFNEILELKRSRPNDVHLLFGNHEFHYLPCTRQRHLGYQMFEAMFISRAITNAISYGLIEMCFMDGAFLFSHAGITKTWCNDNDIRYNLDEVTHEEIVSQINDLFLTSPNAFAFTSGEKNDKFGDEVCQTPVWVRPYSLEGLY